VETTESSNGPMTVESAAELLVQQEEVQPEATEEVAEAEEGQPVADSFDEADDSDDGEVEDVDADEVNEVDDDAEDEDEYEDNEEDVEETDPALEAHTVKVDGQELQVTLEELKRGYSGQQYVQKGMQQVAEARKAAEQQYNALMQERQNLAQLVEQVQHGNIAPPVEPNEEMFKADPIGYFEAKMEYDAQAKKWNAVQQELAAKAEQQTYAEQQAKQAMAQQEAQILMEKIPELRDAGKATQFKKDIVQLATEVYGYPEELLGNITSHRDLLVLRDAMMYRKLMGNEDKVKGKVKKASPVIKPGTKKVTTNNDVARKKRAKLRKSGSVEDALALMLNN